MYTLLSFSPSNGRTTNYSEKKCTGGPEVTKPTFHYCHLWQFVKYQTGERECLTIRTYCTCFTSICFYTKFSYFIYTQVTCSTTLNFVHIYNIYFKLKFSHKFINPQKSAPLFFFLFLSLYHHISHFAAVINSQGKNLTWRAK